MSRLEEIKKWVYPRTGNHPDNVRWLINRVDELEEEKDQDPRQTILEDLYADNQRYKQALEEVREMTKESIMDARIYIVVDKALKGVEGVEGYEGY